MLVCSPIPESKRGSKKRKYKSNLQRFDAFCGSVEAIGRNGSFFHASTKKSAIFYFHETFFIVTHF
jgi:hypothetical protein